MSKLVEIAKEVGKFEIAANEFRDALKEKGIFKISNKYMIDLFVRHWITLHEIFYVGWLAPLSEKAQQGDFAGEWGDTLEKLAYAEAGKVGAHYLIKGSVNLSDYLNNLRLHINNQLMIEYQEKNLKSTTQQKDSPN